MAQAQRTSISIVNYTNTLPFKWAIKNSDLFSQIDLQEDIPSICAQKLRYKQVDLALVPVALIPELDVYFIETDYCIGANGIVDSVKLYSEVPLDQIKNVSLDYQSRTSILLTRVLFKFWWKLNPAFRDAEPGFEKQISGAAAAVVIGDRTFGLNGKYKYEFDLAREWKEFTGLPFVFAAWISREKLPGSFVQEFNKVLKFGVEHVAEAIEDGHPAGLTKEQTREYLTKRIDYRFDEKKLEALRLFLRYASEL